MKLNRFFSLLLLSLTFYSTITLAAHSPAAAPKAPAKPAPAKPAPVTPAPAPVKPLVPALPQSPSGTPGSTNYDIVKILRKAKSFNMFIRLLKTTQVINRINAQLINTKTGGGLTILAPDDGAFAALQVGFLNSLDDIQKIELLQFHVLPSYVSSSNFDSLSNPVTTMAGVNPARLPLNVTAYGNNVNISTGVVNATLTGIVYTDSQLAIYHVDKVLLPLDFFKPKPAAAAPVALAKAPKADKDNSSAEDNDDDGESSKHSSDAKTVIRSQGTTLVSLGVALVAVAIISS